MKNDTSPVCEAAPAANGQGTPIAPAPRPADTHPGAAAATPARFWLALGLVALVTAGLYLYHLGQWPWDHDEVASLIELGILPHEGADNPNSQYARLPRLVPVWYGAQRLALRVLPHDELGARLLPAFCGIAAVLLAFALAYRWRGPWFAAALAVVLDGSQILVWLSQQNRFYSMALLFLTLTLAGVWSRASGAKVILWCAACATLAVLSHNLLVVVFGTAFVAACAAFALGWVSRAVVVRTGVAAAVAAAWYALYLRPIMRGWISGAPGGTPSLVSFLAHAGIPVVALALLGAGLTWLRREERRAMGWWAGLAAGCLLFVVLSPMFLSAWNARYAVIFLPPVWVLAAYGMEAVARRLHSAPAACLWYACVALLFLPKLASHYQDGARHDFRQATQVVIQQTAADWPVYCNLPWALEYYTGREQPRLIRSWDGRAALPDAACVVVYASNLWDAQPRFPGRPAELLAEIGARRFDEQSYVVRVYRVGASGS